MSQQTTPDPNAFLMGGGGSKSASFDNPGDSVEGTVVSHRMMQQSEYGTNKPMFWDNGDPMMQLQIVLQTNLPPADAEDDGKRSIYCKGGFNRATTQKAVSDAVKAAGAPGIEEGGYLKVTFVGYGQGKNPANPPKDYAAQYRPPASQFLGQTQQQVPQQQVPQTQYVQQVPQGYAQPVPGQVDPSAIFPPQG